MSLDLDNLEITYKAYYEITLQIGDLIARELYQELEPYINKRNQILKKAERLVEKIKTKNEDASRLSELYEKIKSQEAKNVEALTALKSNIKLQLSDTSKNVKLLNAYSPAGEKQGNILDYKEKQMYSYFFRL